MWCGEVSQYLKAFWIVKLFDRRCLDLWFSEVGDLDWDLWKTAGAEETSFLTLFWCREVSQYLKVFWNHKLFNNKVGIIGSILWFYMVVKWTTSAGWKFYFLPENVCAEFFFFFFKILRNLLRTNSCKKNVSPLHWVVVCGRNVFSPEQRVCT